MSITNRSSKLSVRPFQQAKAKKPAELAEADVLAESFCLSVCPRARKIQDGRQHFGEYVVHTQKWSVIALATCINSSSEDVTSLQTRTVSYKVVAFF